MKACMIATLSLFFMARSAAAVDTKRCSTAQAEAAERGLGTLQSWSDLQVAFQKFGHCDDGAIAEGYSDFVMRMLASKWGEVGKLQKLAAADPAFRAFVLHHIDETWIGTEFDKLMQNARTQCPARARELCSDFLKRGGELPSGPGHAQRAAQQRGQPVGPRVTALAGASAAPLGPRVTASVRLIPRRKPWTRCS
jgi:hypothetical protein